MELKRAGGFVEHGKKDYSPPRVLMRWAQREAKRVKASSVSYYYEPATKETKGVIGWTGQIEWPVQARTA
jgi:hypothetical protein